MKRNNYRITHFSIKMIKSIVVKLILFIDKNISPSIHNLSQTFSSVERHLGK